MRARAVLLVGLVACGNRSELDGSAASAPTCSADQATRLSPQLLVWASAMFVDATDLYFLTSYPFHDLERLPKTGGEPTILAHDVTSFVLDDDHVYYGTAAMADGGVVGSLYALSKSGGPATVLASGAFSVQSLVADESTLYFVGAFKGPIFALPKTGGTPAFVSDPSSDGVYLFGVDATSLYSISGTTLSSTPKVGGVSEQLVQREDGFRGVALDADNLYFATGSRDIVKLSKATHSPTTLASGLGTYAGSHVVVQAKTLFFDQGQYPARIFSVPIDGGPVQDTCASGTAAIVSIAVDAMTIYWGSITEQTGPLVSLPRTSQ